MDPILERDALRWILSAPNRPDHVIEFCERYLRPCVAERDRLAAVSDAVLYDFATRVMKPLLISLIQRDPSPCPGCRNDQEALLLSAPLGDAAAHTCGLAT